MVAHLPLGRLAVAAGQRVENGTMFRERPDPLRQVAEDELAGGVNIDPLTDQETDGSAASLTRRRQGCAQAAMVSAIVASPSGKSACPAPATIATVTRVPSRFCSS
jgi:hypothetical protein